MQHYIIYDGADVLAFSSSRARAREAFAQAALRADNEQAIKMETIAYCPDPGKCPYGCVFGMI